jgi:hypothetical protein
MYCGDGGPTSTFVELGVSDLGGLFPKITANLIRTGSVVAQHDNSVSPILFSCVDRDYKHLITIGDDKKLKVWEIDGLKVLNERLVPAVAPSCVAAHMQPENCQKSRHKST